MRCRQGLIDDGFNDVDAELAAYLRDPAGYNATAERRIVDAALAQAERARARGETARALAAAGRVLAWRPDEPRALALTAGLSSRSRRVALMIGGGVALLSAVALLGARRLKVTEVPRPPVAAPHAIATPAPVETTLPATLGVAVDQAASRARDADDERADDGGGACRRRPRPSKRPSPPLRSRTTRRPRSPSPSRRGAISPSTAPRAAARPRR